MRIGDDEDGDCHYLGVQKVNAIWRICIGVVSNNCDYEQVKWTPVGNSPIEERIQYFSYIQDLYAEIVKSNEEVVSRLRGAVGDVDASLRFLGLN